MKNNVDLKVRMTQSIKNKIKKEAKSLNLSMSAWMLMIATNTIAKGAQK
jgi:antitoxin component of RelBE/YafQ-DinJ toxin-antitoxin module